MGAEQMDKAKCLPRVLCEASYNGKQKNSTNFQKGVSKIANIILKRNPEIMNKALGTEGVKVLYSMILGNKVKAVSQCAVLHSKTCMDKSSDELTKYMEIMFEKEFMGNDTDGSSQ